MAKRPKEADFLAKRLRALREQTGMTQESFAEHAGVSYKVYQSFEAGRRWNLEMKTVLKLAGIHGLTLSELFANRTVKTKLKLTGSESSLEEREAMRMYLGDGLSQRNG
jgi:DNA-binding XRE family transcriptional regulator